MRNVNEGQGAGAVRMPVPLRRSEKHFSLCVSTPLGFRRWRCWALEQTWLADGRRNREQEAAEFCAGRRWFLTCAVKLRESYRMARLIANHCGLSSCDSTSGLWCGRPCLTAPPPLLLINRNPLPTSNLSLEPCHSAGGSEMEAGPMMTAQSLHFEVCVSLSEK